MLQETYHDPFQRKLDQIVTEEGETTWSDSPKKTHGNWVAFSSKKPENASPLAVDIRRPAQILFHAALAEHSRQRRVSSPQVNVVFSFRKASFAVGISLALAAPPSKRVLCEPTGLRPHGGRFPSGSRTAASSPATVSGLPQEEDQASLTA
jgi:uncharacterized protein (UPF0303 family)